MAALQWRRRLRHRGHRGAVFPDGEPRKYFGFPWLRGSGCVFSQRRSGLGIQRWAERWQWLHVWRALFGGIFSVVFRPPELLLQRFFPRFLLLPVQKRLFHAFALERSQLFSSFAKLGFLWRFFRAVFERHVLFQEFFLRRWRHIAKRLQRGLT